MSQLPTAPAPVRLRWVVLGLLLVQLAWLAALPPFRGIDEWDHAYRASAVAHGQWVATPSAATRGTGALVLADAELVRAAEYECDRLAYTGDAECIGTSAGHLTEVASGAGRYHPLYYALVGYPGRLFSGVYALYAMRIASMVMCLALLGWALWSLCRWSGARPILAVSCGMTPMLMYSTAIVAPNGLEMVAGLALWAALAGLAHDPERPWGHLALATVAGATLLTLRSLGPMWATGIVLTALVAWPGLHVHLRRLVADARGMAAAVTTVLASAASLAWVLSQRSLVIGHEPDQPTQLGARLVESLPRVALWAFQMIGAFPYRDELAVPLVYAGIGSVLILLIIAGFRWSGRRARLALLLGVVPTFLVPYAISVVTLEQYGHAWQGRYALPYCAGLTLICGLAWAGRTTEGQVAGPLVPASLMLVLGHTAATVTVLRKELGARPPTESSAWLPAAEPWLVGIVTAAGVLLVVGPLSLRVVREGARL